MPIENVRIKDAVLAADGWLIALERHGNNWTFGPWPLSALPAALPVLLRISQAREWSAVKGKYVRAVFDMDGAVPMLGHLVNDDEWLAEAVWNVWNAALQYTPGDAK
jgi:hypothetical protein